VALTLKSHWRVPVLATFAVGIEWVRAFAERDPTLTVAAIAGGGLLLCATGSGTPLRDLGIDAKNLPRKVVAGAALGAVLLMPTAFRSWMGIPLDLISQVAIALVAVGEEVAFRGALFSAIRVALGPVAAVAGSAAAFVLAHVFSHPIDFLVPVAALGLLLGIWRWAFDDLIAPITAHVIADVSL
jgi:membrane protease YdiL (CAAX protease family)